MKFERFEDIIVWQKALDLSVLIYNVFEDTKDYGFKDQIQRAGVSIMNNIAEGFERKSNNEFRQFLYISKGSSGEVLSMAILAKKLRKINNEDADKLYSQSEEISKMLSGLIKTL